MKKEFVGLFNRISKSIHWNRNARIFRDSRKELLAASYKHLPNLDKFELVEALAKLRTLEAKIELKNVKFDSRVPGRVSTDEKIWGKIQKKRKELHIHNLGRKN